MRWRRFIPEGITGVPGRSPRPMPFPHGLQFLPPSRWPVKSALVLPMSLGLLAAACGNPSASEAARTDATRLVSSASRNLSVDPVIQWNRELLQIVRTPGAQPATIHPTRSFAILHAAIYDAVNAIDRTHAPYLVRVRGGSRAASKQAAAASAAHEVLLALYPSFAAQIDALLGQSLAVVPDGER